MLSYSNRRASAWVRNFCILFSLFVSSHVALADSVGSDSAVSIQNYYSFPANPILFSNIINGFAWMKNGFQLADNTTACTFNSAFPVSGLVSLNGGTLYLTSDLLFSEGAVLQNLGNLVGSNSKLVDLANTTTLIPNGSTVATFQNIELGFDQDLTLAGTLHINGSVEIDGRSNTLTLSNNGYIIIDNNSDLTFYDVTIVGANANNIRCANAGGSLTLDNVIWYQDDNIFTFTQGSIAINNRVEMIGTATFNYASSKTSTVYKNSVWKFSDGMTLKIGRQTSNITNQPLYLEDPNSTLALENADMVVTASGMSLTRGRIRIDSETTLDVTNSVTTFGLILGDGTSAGDLMINFGAGTVATFSSGAVVSKLINANAFNSASNATKIIRNANSYFNLQQDFTFRNVTTVIDPDSDLDVIYDKHLGFDNCRIELPDGLIAITGRRVDPFTSVLDNGGSLSVLRGILPLNTIISGTGNTLDGSGSISGSLTLANNATTLDLNFGGVLSTNIALNNGTLNLSGNLTFMNDYCFTGSGTLTLGENILTLGAKDLTLGSSLYIDSNRGSIALNSKLTLSTTLTFSGICTLNGNGNEFSFGTVGQINVERGSTVKFKDIKLTDLNTSSLLCIDNQGQIIFEDVTLLVNNQITMTLGNILVDGELDLIGTGTFTFASPGSMTIKPAGTMYARELTLAIGKLTQESPEALIFQDATSTLKLDNVTLYIINQGLCAKKGKVLYVNDITITMDSTDSTNGIILGDGTPENDITLEFLAGSNSKFMNGHTVFNITDQNKFLSHSKTAVITRYPASNYYLNKVVNISNVTINTANGATLTLAPGAALVYDNVTAIAPDYTFDITGTRYNFYTNLLAGNQEIYITKGNLPAYTRVQGTGNAIRGIGNIDGLIYLTDPTAALTMGFDGKLAQSLMVNGGTVTLARNLTFAYDKVCSGPGTVNLGSNLLILGGQDCNWTGSFYVTAATGGMQLNANMNLSSTLTFSGTVAIDGRFHQLTLGPTAQIVVEQGSTLTLRNVTLDSLSGAKLCCANNQSKIIFENVLCRLNGAYTFTSGSIEIREQNDITGTSTFTYLSPVSMSIKSSSELKVENVCLSVGRSTIGGNEPIIFDSSSSILHLNSCGLEVLSNGWKALKGSIFCENDLAVTLHSTSTANGMIIGDGTSVGDPTIAYLPGSTVTYNPGHYYFNYYNPALLTSRSSITKVVRMPGSIFYFASDAIFQNISIDARTGSVTSVAPNAMLDYQNCTIIGNGYTFDLNARRYNSYTNILNGDKELSLTKGTMPCYTLVDSTGNVIRGTGDLGGQLTLTNSSASLTIALDGSIYQPVLLNGGTVSITRDLSLAHNSVFSGSGTLVLQNSVLSFGPQETSLTGTLFINSTESIMRLNNRATLSGSITTSGMLTIEGNGNSLEFDPTGQFIVNTGSTIHFRDITIKNLANLNLCVADNSATIILENTNLVLSGDYSFTAGTLIMQEECFFSGAYTFTLSSQQPAQIHAYSSMILQNGINFTTGRYGDVAGTEPLDFTDHTSKFVLKDCTYSILPTGMSLLRGQLLFSDDTAIQTYSTSTADGLILGDNTPENDPTISWLAGSRMNFLMGHITYNAASPTQFESFSKTSNLSIGANTLFYVQTDCILSSIFLLSDPAALLLKADGKYFLYNDVFNEFAGQQYNLTAYDFNPSTFLLDDGGVIILSRGTYYPYTVVNGTGNLLLGVGDVYGPITLTNDAAQLNFNMQGSILNNITLNGGTMVLDASLNLANDVMLSGSGIVDLEANVLQFGHRDVSSTSTLTIVAFEGGILNLPAIRTISGTWTLSGHVLVNGQRTGQLDLDDTGQIIIAPNSTVTFKDITLGSVNATNLICADPSSTIIFDNVFLQLRGDYTFSTGAFIIQNYLDISGSYTFVYASDQASHIRKRGTLFFGHQTNFNYAPTSTAQNLIVMDDELSIIQCKDSTIYITPTGIQLTTGQLIIQGISALVGPGIYAPFILGDDDASRDCILDIRNGALVTVNSSILTYKNVAQTSFIFDASSFLDFASDGGLALHYTLASDMGLIRFYDGATLLRKMDATLNVPIQLLGGLVYDIIP